MAIPTYLAMTGAEFQSCVKLPDHIAWMACHFSPYGGGLSNLPPALPPDSLLILNDRIPPAGHDPQLIEQQLHQTVEALSCRGVLLDFQREKSAETARLVSHLTKASPFPVIVSDIYATESDCPVFLSPCPHHVPLSQYITPWQGREIWLDIAYNAETILLTKEQSVITPLPLGELPEGGHADPLLHCHYSIEQRENSAQFTLWRTKGDIQLLAEESETLRVDALIGLYTELSIGS